MKKLLNGWFGLGWYIIGVGVSILILPVTLIAGVITIIISKVLR